MSAGEDHGHGQGHDGHHVPPPLPEPVTPMWLPALGVALFVLAGAWYVGSPSSAAADTQQAAAATADAGATP